MKKDQELNQIKDKMSIKDIMNDRKALLKIAKATFDAADIDKSGYLDQAELDQVIKKIASDIGVEEPTKEEVR